MTYVVHLEDDGPLREILKVAFQATDPHVNLQQFISGDEVVAHIKPIIETIDLFVLDIRVPGSIDGLGVARKIREFGSEAPIILTSAYRPPERELIQSLSLEWMSKPWHIMEIAQRLVTLAKNQRAKVAKTAAAASAPVTTTADVPAATPEAPVAASPTPPSPVTSASPATVTPNIAPVLPTAPVSPVTSAPSVTTPPPVTPTQPVAPTPSVTSAPAATPTPPVIPPSSPSDN